MKKKIAILGSTGSIGKTLINIIKMLMNGWTLLILPLKQKKNIHIANRN